jgi:hypothetical protein
MPDQEEYVIEIYTSPKGVVMDTTVNGSWNIFKRRCF